jgi:GT2 family glycosyltransferase
METVLAVLMTCFNRKATTLRSLAALDTACAGVADYRVYLVDDNSSDGTAHAVAAQFPDVRIVKGSGNLYWNGGMRLAWQTAIPDNPDFYLWLNDDTVLRPDAIRDMLELYRAQGFPKTIVAGRTVDPVTKSVTYGGYRKAPGLSQLRFRRLARDELYCDSMNGNCVLIPRGAVDEVGINSDKYRHAFGDNDYGLRASRHGYRIVELKNPVAEQSKNLDFIKSTSVLTLGNWRKILLHPKGVPAAEWWWFCRQHGGLLWPVNFLWRYLKMLRLRAE